MVKYKNKEIEALERQLRYLPPETQARVADRLEDLLRSFSLESEYSYEFLYFKLTGFKPDENLDKKYRGRDIRLDLLDLLSDLTEEQPTPVRNVDEYVYSIEELEKMYNISIRTIFRWRKKGLVSRKYLFPDGRKRTGVRKSSLQGFINEHSTTVERSSRFSKLSAAEKKQIIQLARFYVASHGLNLTTAADRISRELGRSRETVRYILRRHDAASPEDRIFPEKPSLEVDRLEQAVYAAYKAGEGASELCKRFKLSRSTVYRFVHHCRALEILNEDFTYIPSPEFDQPDADAVILETPEPALPPEEQEQKAPSNPSALPPYLRSLYDTPLLSRAQEQYLFRKLNYLKYKISKLRTGLDVSGYIPSKLLTTIDDLWSEAVAVKNRILKANLRLVVSVAKRHATPSLNLFDLISEGNFCLMYAIDKFDYARGNRFSTYATWALMKSFARTVPEESHRVSTFVTGQQEILNTIPVRGGSPDEVPFEESLRDRLLDIVSQLTDREQQVIRCRFGLDTDGKKLTLAEVGDALGVTRERIRQIETRALEKMRRLLEDHSAELAT